MKTILQLNKRYHKNEIQDASSVPEIAAAINALKRNSKAMKPEQIAQQASVMRKYASRLCSIGTLEACECFLDVMEYSSVTTASIAKYGLTAIANCTSSEEARNQLMQMGAGKITIVLFLFRVCMWFV